MPARSPMPLIVHSTWRAPACTAASELATASPRSLWQWTLIDRLVSPSAGDQVARSGRRTRRACSSRRCPGCSPCVAPAATTAGGHGAEVVEVRCASRPRPRTPRRPRSAAPGAPPRRPRRAPAPASCAACSWRWMSLVAMKVWMRGRSAASSAAAARVMSGVARAREARRRSGRGRRRRRPRTASKSPSEAIGKPASSTSTPSSASFAAIRSFSRTVMLQPGDCSPSRRVVSKIVTRWAHGLASFPGTIGPRSSIWQIYSCVMGHK